MNATAEWLDTDYYEVLGVAVDATPKQIKSAYRRLARTAHPDANPDDPTAEQRFSDIAKAYEVLSDTESRAEYDNLRLQAQRQPIDPGYGRWSNAPRGAGAYGSGGYVDLNDLFGDLFAEQAARPRRGSDVAASLTLDFVDAVHGLTTTLTVDDRSLNVRIPAGVEDQQTIRLSGKGRPGMNGGPPGDLLIKVSVREHPRFGRKGRHLTVTVPVRYDVAVLGGEMRVPTLDGGSVTVRIPAGTPVGKTFRVPGKGVPLPAKAGDLLATVTIDVPTSVSDEDAELLRRLS